MVKTGKKSNNELGEIFHFDVYGKRDTKYSFLKDNGIDTINYVKLPNRAPNYFMTNKDFDAMESFKKGFLINHLFPLNNVGIVTSRDGFVIADSKKELKTRIKAFFNHDKEYLLQNFNLRENKRWKIDDVKSESNQFNPKSIRKINYRPFDTKFIYYNDQFIERNRMEVMQHFILGENIALTIGRQGQVTGSPYWDIVSITNKIIDFNYYRRGGELVFPLYLYPEESFQQTLDGKPELTPNLDKKLVSKIADKLKLKFVTEKEDIDGTFAPIDLLDYIYAVLHSPSYREKYKEFLKIDFPRVPYPEDQDTFWQLVELGGELRKTHLLEHPKVEDFITTYPESGTNIISNKLTKNEPGFIPDHGNDSIGKVWINEEQYFGNVPTKAWEFYIGGYQPAEKWLKDRRDRELSIEEIQHYQKIIVALTETDHLMQEIDKTGFMTEE